MASVELDGVTKSFGAVEAVRDVSLSIPDREFVVFVGPSGCGKSTLLRMIAGLEELSDGEIKIGGQRVNEVPAADRGVAMVFQSYALYPHMSVAQNMGFGLRMSGVASHDVEAKVSEAASILQIEELLHRRPRELSGGQRQRVAIGRAITRSPDVFLFDEPLSNLDAGLRAQMRVELARLHASFTSTMIYVTHDQVEAMTLADRIVLLNGGRVEQQGPPLELYEHPDNMFVASFLGQPKINFLEAVAEGANGTPFIRLSSGEQLPFPAGLEGRAVPGMKLVLGIRPDAIAVANRKGKQTVRGSVELVEHLGSETLIHVRLAQAPSLLIVAVAGKSTIRKGDDCHISFNPDQMLLFEPGGDRLKPSK